MQSFLSLSLNEIIRLLQDASLTRECQPGRKALVRSPLLLFDVDVEVHEIQNFWLELNQFSNGDPETRANDSMAWQVESD